MRKRRAICAECGMPVDYGEYHPHAACLMFKACGDAEEVRAQLASIKKAWREIGYKEGLADAKRNQKRKAAA